ncbi:MAG TPA: hydroxysqualene dehydroxylase HpnE [Mycobacteriales bacterium]|nr:hydroxysqualene dehydroxylase HpnE [Mycobacteriales bacterium]
MTASAAVVGGGLAGITAALGLADAGFDVQLLEAKPRLGGLTHSFRRGPLDVDNGQHVFMRCCTSYRGLLDRLGVAHLTTLQPRLDVPVVRAADARTARLRRDALPAPLHLARALGRYRLLAMPDRVRAVRAALALRLLDRVDPRLDERSFGDWLAAHAQSAAAVEGLWDLVGVATMNAPASEASLAIAATVFQLGLLTEAGAADIGWAQVPLQQLHGDAAARALAAAGASVRLRSGVRRLARSAAGWTLTLADGALAADVVVLATDPRNAEHLLPGGALGLAAGWSRRLGSSPIVNLHLVFDRTVLTEPILAGAGTPALWLFDRTRQAGLRSGQYVAVSLSAADALLAEPVGRLRERFTPVIHRMLPAARDAALLDFFVTRERHATFRPAPGSARSRPPTGTRADGLFLAGAHCATGWPATMEGAVRSGEAAVRAVLAAARAAGAAVAA